MQKNTINSETQIKSPRFINALLRQPVDRTPVWLMRQAGRYLPEYRALREKVPDFMTFCRTPELAAQATLQPLARFDLDAAIIFSDILVVPEAMGLSLQFIKGEGPCFSHPVRSLQAVEQLQSVNVDDDLGYVLEAIRLVKPQLPFELPLIGFAGSPWTCATYMVEGQSSRQFAAIKTLLYQQPQVMHALLQKITDVTIDYLNAQIAAGVQVVMLFDSWGGVLSHADYPLFSLQYMQTIKQHLTRTVNGQTIPVIFFTKGGGQWLSKIADSGCDAVSVDWTTSLAQARALIGDRVALQGNLDPCLLLSNPARIEQAVQQILNDYGHGPGHVFNLGHGVLPPTPPEHVQVMIDAVHRLSAI